MPCAGKTGTTSDKKDGWFCGFTPYYTMAVWVGYDSPKTLNNLYGNTYPLTIWRTFMEEIHQNLERKEFAGYEDLPGKKDSVVSEAPTEEPTEEPEFTEEPQDFATETPKPTKKPVETPEPTEEPVIDDPDDDNMDDIPDNNEPDDIPDDVPDDNNDTEEDLVE